MDMVRSMMSYSDMPNSFWGDALETTAYILNLLPSKLVAMLKSIWILLFIAAYFDYEIWQMDVKTTLLNVSLYKCNQMIL